LIDSPIVFLCQPCHFVDILSCQFLTWTFQLPSVFVCLNFSVVQLQMSFLQADVFVCTLFSRLLTIFSFYVIPMYRQQCLCHVVIILYNSAGATNKDYWFKQFLLFSLNLLKTFDTGLAVLSGWTQTLNN
jgi:hypothetical protein